ncbi:MAG TPA: hypothetical protein VGI40_12840 [Pirellulaceae bacterium]|jgi:hypothetical protein
MQLDRTRIAIRERGLLETIDLSLLVIREFAGPLIVCALLAIVPLAIINELLVGWMVSVDDEGTVSWFRYTWAMTVLIFLESQLASVFIVAYLGPAVFMEQRTIRQIAGDVLRQAFPILLCQGILRGVLAAWLLYLLTERYEANGWIEGFWIVVVCLFAIAMRTFRPYINEIILLEKNPLLAGKSAAITVSKRSSHLHGAYSGDLFVRSFATTAIAASLVCLAIYTASLTEGFLFSKWPLRFSFDDGFVLPIDGLDLHVLYPACLWLVVAFFAVVRFLSYLDLRIRHEGWEVELLMRAEAVRLGTQLE